MLFDQFLYEITFFNLQGCTVLVYTIYKVISPVNQQKTYSDYIFGISTQDLSNIY